MEIRVKENVIFLNEFCIRIENEKKKHGEQVNFHFLEKLRCPSFFYDRKWRVIRGHSLSFLLSTISCFIAFKLQVSVVSDRKTAVRDDQIM